MDRAYRAAGAISSARITVDGAGVMNSVHEPT
jgi:hypothetical protein